MRYGYVRPNVVTLTVNSPQTINLSNNDTQRFQVAFAINQTAINLNLVIVDFNGATIYNQTWNAGFMLSANMVKWKSIAFTDASYGYSFTVFTKEINLDNNTTDDADARSQESIIIQPLVAAQIPSRQTVAYSAPTIQSINSAIPTSGSTFVTGNLALAVASDIIIVPQVGLAITMSSGGTASTLTIDSSVIDNSSAAMPVTVNYLFDAISQSNVASGNHTFTITATGGTVGAGNTGYWTFNVISIPHATNNTFVFAQVNGATGASQNASIGGTKISVATATVSGFSMSFVTASVAAFASSPNFTVNLLDQNSAQIGSTITDSALPYTNNQTGIVGAPTSIQIGTFTPTNLTGHAAIVGYVSQVILSA